MADFTIIGSAALKDEYPDLRNPKDIDIVITQERFDNLLNGYLEDIEYVRHSANGLSHIVKFYNDPQLREYFIADRQKSLRLLLSYGKDNSHAPLGILYSLKKSHIHYPIKFYKHIEDYQIMRTLLRSKLGVDIIEDLQDVSQDLLDTNPELTKALIEDTEARLGPLRTPKMNQTTEQFFGKSKKFVKSYYVHDDMHKAIAQMHEGYPVYENILKDNSEVETDFEKWKKLSVTEMIYCVLEEVYVIALERKILPMLFEKDAPQWTAKDAFDWALMRVCTTLCDGFFREFATRAYRLIRDKYDGYYVEKFLREISQYDRIEAE